MPQQLPEWVVPVLPEDSSSGTQEDAPVVIAIGGIGSEQNDKFFSTIKEVAPGAQRIWLRGSGRGIRETGMKNASAYILHQINEAASQNKRVLVIGHSLGATIAHNLESQAGPNARITYLKVDPPYNTPWKYAPPGVANISPIASAINQSVQNGIANDPFTLSWTDGKTVMWGSNPTHAPWNDLAVPGNQERVNSFKALVQKNMTAAQNNVSVGNPAMTSADWRQQPATVKP